MKHSYSALITFIEISSSTARRTSALMRKMIFMALVLLAWGAMILPVAAQKTSPERGFNPGNSYLISDIESISPQSGNLMLNIPVGALPAGRGGMSAGVSLHYNSKIWNSERPVPVEYEVETLIPSEDGSWKYGYEYKLKVETDCDKSYSYKLSIVTPDGGEHLLWLPGHTDIEGYVQYAPDGTLNCANPPVAPAQSSTFTYSTIDGSYLRVVVTGDGDANQANNQWTLYLPNGSKVIHNPQHVAHPETGLLQQIVDRNGNSIDFIETTSDPAYNNHKTTSIKDQLERKLVIEYGADTNQDWIHSKGYDGAALVTRVQWKTIIVHKTYHWCLSCAGGNKFQTLSQDFQVVDKVYLAAPSGNLSQFGNLFYSFDYNADATSDPSTGWGEVSQVTLPSGASSAYTYAYSSTASSPKAVQVLKNYPSGKTLTYLKENDGTTQSASDTWTYASTQPIFASTANFTYTTTAPDGGVSIEYYGSWNGSSAKTPSKYNEGYSKPYKSVAADGSVTERVYANNLPTDSAFIAAANQFVKYEFTSIVANGSLTETAIKEYSQDKNGNLTQVKEYDFVPYSAVQGDDNGRLTGLPENSKLPNGVSISTYLKRVTNTEYYAATPDASSTDYTNSNSYHQTTAPPMRAAVKASESQDGSGQHQARSEMSYDDATTTANLTASKAWDSTKGAYSDPLTLSNSISISHQYDSYGNPTLSTDARGYQTQITYGAVGGFTGLYPTQTIAASNSSIQRTASQVYDFNTGLVTSSTDVDNNVSTSTAYDALGRPKLIKAALGTAQERWTQTEYSDQLRRVIVKADLNTPGDGKQISIQYYDQLGRVRLSRQLENPATEDPTDEEDGIKVQTRYQTGNPSSYQITSNPYRVAHSTDAITEPSMGWTRSTTLNTGRHREVETFDGANLPAPWSDNVASSGAVKTDIDGDRTLVTDQALKQRISQVNALGQMINVWEVTTASEDSPVAIAFPNHTEIGHAYQTSYTYDPLNNLKTVTQGGQTRSFTYSSLSRLISATNPEICNAQGTPLPITYGYDGNGNLTSKTDARSITTTYSYDALNRVTLRDYSDSTPDVTYGYDATGVAHAKGRLTSISSSVSTSIYNGYDALGQASASTQTTDGQSYTMGYSYNRAGEMTSQTYPSGRVVTTEYDSAGRMAGVKNQSTGSYYAGGVPTTDPNTNPIQYTAHGAISAMKLGNGLWEHTSFNNRLQPTLIGLGTSSTDASKLSLGYAYGTTDNNGNVQSQTITAPNLSLAQSYQYDDLNRLSQAQESSGSTTIWTQGFSYDRYGNRRFNDSVTTIPQLRSNPTISPTTNHLDGYGYDQAGNVTSEPQAHTYVFDGENRIASVDNGVDNYSYDGDGRRVKKVTATETTIFVYNASGQMVAEYSTATPTGISGTSYLTADNLGTPRVITDASGAVKSRHDYLPFGEEIPASFGNRSAGTDGHSSSSYGASDNLNQKFTGKERDAETNLDYFGERYYSSSIGRFISADPLGGSARLSNPQTMNRYVYVLNNPMRYVDPDGLKEKDPWDQLSKEEQNAISGKLELDNKHKTNRDAFNDLVRVPSDANATADRIDTLKNFIVAAGGLKDSEVWNQIDSIKGVETSKLTFTIYSEKQFQSALRNEGYWINNALDKVTTTGSTYGSRLETYRQLTPNSTDPELHFTKNAGSSKFEAHWDPTSVNFAIIQPFYLGLGGGNSFTARKLEQGAAALGHGTLATPAQVREYQKKTNQVPNQ